MNKLTMISNTWTSRR